MKFKVVSVGVIYSLNQKSTSEKLAYIDKLNVTNKVKQIQFIDLKYDFTVSRFIAPYSLSSSSTSSSNLFYVPKASSVLSFDEDYFYN